MLFSIVILIDVIQSTHASMSTGLEPFKVTEPVLADGQAACQPDEHQCPAMGCGS
jgi:hypothetical protein